MHFGYYEVRLHTTLKYRCPFKIRHSILWPISVEYVGHLHSLEPTPISNHPNKIHLFMCGLKKIFVKSSYIIDADYTKVQIPLYLYSKGSLPTNSSQLWVDAHVSSK